MRALKNVLNILNTKSVIVFILMLLFTNHFAQQGRNTIMGVIEDSETQQRIANANIVIDELEFYTTSNNFGIFIFNNIPDGEFTFITSHIAYNEGVLVVDIISYQK